MSSTPTSPSPLPKAEAAFDDVRLDGLIHESAKTQIFRATTALGLPLIVKRLKPEMQNAANIARLKHEFELLRGRDIKQARRPLAMVEIGGLTALLHADEGGLPLSEAVRARPWSWQELTTLFIDLAQGLAELHIEGIVHRDINPQNILVLPNGRPQYIDFGIASVLAHSDLTLPIQETLEGTLAYIAPEQTGRTGKPADERSDLYALGATFYEIVTGRPPFSGRTGLELIHAHLAQLPPDPATLRPDSPVGLARIILKLLAKSPEDRYRGMVGVLEDLKLLQFKLQHPIALVPPSMTAGHDPRLRLSLPRKIYGRDRELRLLREGWEDLQGDGGTALLLVGGASGSGKTTLVNGLVREVFSGQADLVAGKFEEFGCDLPYQGLLSAAQQAWRMIRARGANEFSTFSQALSETLGVALGPLSELLPELSALNSGPKSHEQIPPVEAKRLIQTAFIRYFCACSTPGRPLVIFIDDLQWADSESLELLSALTSFKSPGGILIIGAFRNHGYGMEHPLARALEVWKSDQEHCLLLELGDLSEAAVCDFCKDLIDTEQHVSERLAKLLHQRTKGNPFFMQRHVLSLYREGLIRFSLEDRAWSVDLDAIALTPVAENVVDLLTAKISHLPYDVQKTLAIAALIGTRFDLNLLSKVKGDALEVLQDQALLAAAHDLIFKADVQAAEPVFNNSGNDHLNPAPPEGTETAPPIYVFLHDRILEACHALLPPEELRSARLALANELLKEVKERQNRGERTGPKLFQALQHFNDLAPFITNDEQRIELVRLNKLAGDYAAESSSWGIASQYYAHGERFLPGKTTADLRQLRREIYYGLGSMAMLAGQVEEADSRFQVLLDEANTDIEAAAVQHLRCRLYISLGLNQEAIAIGLDGLKRLGVNLSRFGSMKLAVFAETRRVKRMIKDLGVDAILQLKVMNEPRAVLIMQLLMETSHPCLLVHPEKAAQIALVQIRHVLTHGHSPQAAFPFLYLLLMLNASMSVSFLRVLDAEDVRDLLHIYQNLDRRYTPPIERLRGQFVAATFSAHMHENWPQVTLRSVELIPRFIDHGDAFYAGTAMLVHLDTAFIFGRNTAGLLQKWADWSAYAKRYIKPAELLSIQNFVASFEVLSYGSRAAVEQSAHCGIASTPDTPNSRLNHLLILLHQGLVYCLLRDFPNAFSPLFKAARKGVQMVFAGNTKALCFHPYFVMAISALYPNAPRWRRPLLWLLARWSLAVLAIMQRVCPAAIQGKLRLAEAFWHRAKGRPLSERIMLLQQSISGSTALGAISDLALAAEALGRELLELGAFLAARSPLETARSAYQRWGIKFKFEELDLLVRQLPDAGEAAVDIAKKRGFARTTVTTTTSNTTEHSAEGFDAPTLVNAAYALSKEIKLSDLKAALVGLLRENAGARTAALVWKVHSEDNNQETDQVVAYANAEGAVDVVPQVLDNQRVSLKAVQFVAGTGETLIVDDVSHDSYWQDDVGLRARSCRSMMCMPVYQNGQVHGLIYLENDLLEQAFTSARVKVLSVLAGQLAISLQNALLYEKLDRALRAERDARALEQKVHAEFVRAETARRNLQASLDAAEAVQQSLLALSPKNPSYEMDYLYVAAERAGGDWLSTHLDLKRGWLYAMLGDVTGHGVSSALVTAAAAGAAASAIERVSRQGHSLGSALIEICSAMNDAVCWTGAPSGRMMTMVLIAIDLASGQACYVNAGHMPVLMASDKVTNILHGGNPLGHSRINAYVARDFALNKGARLLLYSDGLIENRRLEGEPLGVKGLRRLVLEHQDPTSLISRLREVCAGFESSEDCDDAAAIALRWPGPS